MNWVIVLRQRMKVPNSHSPHTKRRGMDSLLLVKEFVNLRYTVKIPVH
jgi:hypothetical protein